MKYCTVCKTKYDDGLSFCPADGEVLENDPTSIVGSNLDGQYRIDALLGQGGMGAVYKARHILLGDQVAIKVLPPQMRNNAEWLRRFQREGQAARRFRHPNSVTVYDLRTTKDGLIYLVMEYVEGNTLDAELKRRGKMSPFEAFAVLEPIMSVLNAAHAVGVVHRDLKPENIMIGKVDADGLRMTKLLDLGIAKISELAGSESKSGTALTMAGQILGTPFYMSPEQWGEMPRDENPEIDGRADIYSLAAVFYEMVSGRRPFEAATLQEVRRVHVFVAPTELSRMVPGVPEAFSKAVMGAMAKDRSERPASMAEFSNELRQSLGLSPATRALNVSPVQADAVDNAATLINSPLDEPVRQTMSDVSAPTVITLDSEFVDESTLQRPEPPGLVATQPSFNSVPIEPFPSPPLPSKPIQAIPTNTEIPRGTSQQATVPQQVAVAMPTPSAKIATPAKKRLSILIPIALVLLLGVVVAGAGVGWYLWQRSKTAVAEKPVESTMGPVNGLKDGSSKQPEGTTEQGTDLLRYWIEPTKSRTVVIGSRLTENPTLGSNDEFRFHFSAEKPGFLYIVGTGPKNEPLTFLTAKPVEESGVKTNALQANSDYVFPQIGNIGLDKNSGTEVYTILFSPTRLSEPAFLGAKANRELKGSERADYDALVSRYSANSPVISVNNTDPGTAYVAVRTNDAASSGQVVFQIRLQHK
jgi:serine/threonine protein kinase